MTPAQERAARIVDDDYIATAALTAALDEAEMVEAIRNAPCLIYPEHSPHEDAAFVHPECAARAVLDLVLGTQ
jgi:hypothetical protein